MFSNNVYTYIQEQKGSSKRETLVWRDKFVFLETIYNLMFLFLFLACPFGHNIFFSLLFSSFISF